MLFNGESLDGWVQKNGTATYEVRDQSIVGTTVEGSWNSFLCTQKEYGDFELEFEVRVDDRLNSGVQIRSKQRDKTIGNGPNMAAGRVIGPQVEIEASRGEGAESGYIYGEATGLGWLTPKDRLRPHQHFQDGQWNTFRVLAEGPRIRTWINGEQVEDLTHAEAYSQFPRGFIGLQVHRVKPEAGPFQVAWRNIRIRELDQQPVATPFNHRRRVIPGTIEAEHYDLGPAGVAYHDVDPQNRGADFREETQVDIEKREDASGGHGIGWTRKSEWLMYSIHVQQSGRYSLKVPVASNMRGGTFHLEINGKDISGPIHVPDTGGWDKLQVIQIDGIDLLAGDHQMKMAMDEEGPSGSIGDIDCLIFSKEP